MGYGKGGGGYAAGAGGAASGAAGYGGTGGGAGSGGYGADIGGGASGAYNSLNSGFGAGGSGGFGAGGALSNASPVGGYGGTNLTSGGMPGNLTAAGAGNIPANLYDQAGPGQDLGGQNVQNIAQTSTAPSETFPGSPNQVTTQAVNPNSLSDQINPTQGPTGLSGNSSSFTQGWSGGAGPTVEAPGTGLSQGELSAANQAEASAFGTGAGPTNPLGNTGTSWASGAQPVDTTGMMSVGPPAAGNIGTGLPQTGADPWSNPVVAGTASPAVDASTGAPVTADSSTSGPGAPPAPASTAGASANVAASQANTNAIPGTAASPAAAAAGTSQISQALSSMGMPAQAIGMLSAIFNALARHQNPNFILQQMMRMIQQGMTQGGGPWGANQGFPGAWSGMRHGQQLIAGQVMTGPDGQRYRYNGGDPNNQASWTQVAAGGSSSGAPAAAPASSSSPPPASLQA